jgi:xanthine dehydrogenase accessory factor
MREIIQEIDTWRASGEEVALATVVATWGSAPRGLGAKMAVSSTNRIAGSVSGGCVEGAVVEAAQQTLSTRKARLLHFGVADETAWAVGLACGGKIEVFVSPLDASIYGPLRDAMRANHAAAHVTVVAGPDPLLGRSLLVIDGARSGGSLAESADAEAADLARQTLTEGRSRRATIRDCDVFVDVLLPPPTLIVVGGVHIALGLVSLAKTLGYRTVVVDPRTAFGNRDRFPGVDELRNDWPDDALRAAGLHAGTAVAVLTHDPKLDDPALQAALPSAAFYVGALGGKATQEKRRKRLLAAGLSEAHLARLHAPIGLDIGGRSPEEIALSVMAEVVAARNGRASR